MNDFWQISQLIFLVCGSSFFITLFCLLTGLHSIGNFTANIFFMSFPFAVPLLIFWHLAYGV